MSRSVRRHQKQRMKDNFERKEKLHCYWTYSVKNAGIYSSTRKTCSCPICGNPRKYRKDKLTRQEKISKLNEALE
jgi:hypothetical protein